MADSALVDRLAALPALAGVPREQLEWLVDHGELRHAAVGEHVFRTLEMPTKLFVMLSGHLSITINRGSGPRKLAEWRGGDLTGVLPFSRMMGSPGEVIAEQATEALTVDREHFPQMIRDCFELTSVLVHVMVDRARLFRSNELHDEKMLSLGKLSAGLAHELNNPASAVARSSKSLTTCLTALDQASFALGAAGLSPSQMALITRLRDAGPRDIGSRTTAPLEMIEREEAIRDWLDRHNLDEAQAETLAEASVGIPALDDLAAGIDAATIPAALVYLAMAWSVRKLTYEIETAASRIHGLVSAVKGFTYMDQASVPKPVDLARGLADTLIVLRAKAKAKSAEIAADIEPNLPHIVGFGGELNQVWSNLIDNALDAVPQGGHVSVAASRERDSIVVRVTDDGPGVPAEIRDRIFDPFFTTKGVGDGTGLGLDIARRLVERHSGEIELGSVKGRTEFKVTLPIGGAGPRQADETTPVTKPVILTVDDDREVLAAIERDLRAKYREQYRVVAAESARKALDVVRHFQQRATPVALFLVDQRMPEMTGTQFLIEARKLSPDAKRVLLTAYADTEAAIAAINNVGLHHYLMKPWDPPEERLYPVLNDLLAEWTAHARPPFEGVRVAGSRWSPQSYLAREFLSRNQIPYQWIDIDLDAPTRELVQSLAGDVSRLPVVLFQDGSFLVAPGSSELAAKVGLQTLAKRPFYDMVIIGGGPAGLSSAVYGASEGLHVLLVEQNAPGGQAGTSSMIENYLGFPAGVTGADLAQRATAQARRFGAELLVGHSVVGVRREDPFRIVKLSSGTEVSCHALVLATGLAVREIEVQGIHSLLGAGVYYGAAMTEAAMYRDQDVCVLGGANSAGQAALFFSRYVRKVTMLVRAADLGAAMSQYLVDRIRATANIEVMTRVELTAVCGNRHLEGVALRQLDTHDDRSIESAALFIFIGVAPRTEALAGFVQMDEKGFIVTGQELRGVSRTWALDRDPLMFETSVPGVFAVGDVRAGANRRVAAAVGEGSAAVFSVHQYLRTV